MLRLIISNYSGRIIGFLHMLIAHLIDFLTLDPTQPDPIKTENFCDPTRPDPTRPVGGLDPCPTLVRTIFRTCEINALKWSRQNSFISSYLKISTCCSVIIL